MYAIKTFGIHLFYRVPQGEMSQKTLTWTNPSKSIQLNRTIFEDFIFFVFQNVFVNYE